MPTIYDNIEEILATDLKETLQQSYKSDFCVGYFNLRGWKNVTEYIENFEGNEDSCCRLIVGMQRPPEDLLKQIVSKQKEGLVDQAQVVALKKAMSYEFREQLTFGIPDAKDEIALQQLANQLLSGKVKVKLYLSHPLHAKLYLCYRNDKKSPIIGYVGSSNLTFSGLEKQGELNVDVVEKDAAEKLAEWFNDRWEDRYAIDISEELAEIIGESWAGEKTIPPYYIYLKIAYHLSQEAQTGENNFDIPKEFNHLLPFQKKAVTLAAQHLHNRNGVIIGDVVGLGKTMTASALAKLFEDTFVLETLIICPKNLVEMWKDYVHKYHLRAVVKSISTVNDTWLEKERRYRLIIIDESHNLRNKEGKRYGFVKDYIDRNETKVILLTATPYNKTYYDLSNQLRLFISEDLDLGISPERYIESIGGQHEYKAIYDTSPFSIAAFEKSEFADDWRDLLKMFLVRRTRSFIRDNYAETDEENNRKFLTFDDGNRFYFPDRIPRKIEYDFDIDNPDDVYASLFSKEVVDTINKMTLPRYGLGQFIDDNKLTNVTEGDQKQLDNLTRAGKRLMGFCRTNLFKRLESSGYAFLISLARHAMRNYVYIHAIENKIPLPIGSQETSVMDEFLEEHDENLQELGQISIHCDLDEYLKGAEKIYNTMAAKPQKFKWISPEYFKPSLKKKLKKDAEIIMQILNLGKDWESSFDKKIDSLEELASKTHKDEKILIFTQFADTAKYLENELKRRGLTEMECVTGNTENPTASAHKFSPFSNEIKLKGDETRILITTDVLSEGQNLQDAHIIVNFDLPWALIRLIQRAGRVDRIGQKSPEIYCYSFLPAEGVETIINLRSRLQNRIHENSEVVGSDEVFFDGDPVNIRDLYNEKADILDEDEGDDDVDLTSKAYEIWNQAIKANPSLKKTITQLPNVVYSTKEKPDFVLNNGVITYHKTPAGTDILTWLDESGNVRSRSQNRILKILECSIDTPAVESLINHHKLVEKSVDISNKIQKSTGGHLGKKSSSRYKTYMRLNRYFDETKNTLFENQELKKAIDDIFKYPMQESAKNHINVRLRLGISDEELAEFIINKRNEGKLSIMDNKVAENNMPRVICSMGLNENI
ncbi:MAG: helicase-related protein [Bacteroidales bacterium]|nr:helicase-related protein [Bacteroidales bacterium]